MPNDTHDNDLQPLPLQDDDASLWEWNNEYQLRPPPPFDSGLSTAFVDERAVSTSREAQAGYIERYWGNMPEDYPLRIKRGRLTGLPAFLNGLLAQAVDLEGDDWQGVAVEAAAGWLFQDLQSRFIFGAEEPGQVSQRLIFDHAIRFHRGAKGPEMDRKQEYPGPIRYAHVFIQQRYRGWPVLSAGVVVHLVNGDKRVACTNTFLPMPEGLELPGADEGLTPEEAIEAAARFLRAAGLFDRDYRLALLAFKDSERLVAPFSGQYHLVYYVEALASDGLRGWRLFVDAGSGKVLGDPDPLLYHDVSYYASSGDLTAANPAPIVDTSLTPDDLSAAVQLFAHFDRAGATGGTYADVLAGLNSGAPADQALALEFTNVAAHALKLYDHLTGPCGVVAENLHAYQENGFTIAEPGLQIIVGVGGALLSMGFSQSGQQVPRVVSFQSDPGQGIDEGSKTVLIPSLDPEVLYHEMAHGFMWLLNKSPFDQQHDSAPFGRAYVEGAANYLARSLADRIDSVADSDQARLWARAAYRQELEIDGQDRGWGEDWALSRSAWLDGQDLLPVPNLYPDEATAGLPVYHVGMIWARALWDVRQQVLGDDLTDKLVLQSLPLLLGWMSSFEMAAEAFIDRARLEGNIASAQVEQIIDLFAGRNILAERGVRTLGQAQLAGDSLLFAGTDQGLQESADGENWPAAIVAAPATPGLGVVGLAAGDNTVLAATEAGVFELDSAHAVSAVGAWPVTVSPLSLHRNPQGVSQELFAGTTNGVLRCDLSAGGGWQPWNNADKPFAVLAITSFSDGSRHVVVVAGLGLATRVFYNDVHQQPPTWRALGRLGDAEDWPLCLAIHDQHLYAGTRQHGLFRLDIQLQDHPAGVRLANTAWTPIAADRFGGRALLCLHVDQNAGLLYAGASDGLHMATIGPGGALAWQIIDLPVVQPIVTAVLAVEDRLLVGTAKDGLLLRRPSGGGVEWVQIAVGL